MTGSNGKWQVVDGSWQVEIMGKDRKVMGNDRVWCVFLQWIKRKKLGGLNPRLKISPPWNLNLPQQPHLEFDKYFHPHMYLWILKILRMVKHENKMFFRSAKCSNSTIGWMLKTLKLFLTHGKVLNKLRNWTIRHLLSTKRDSSRIMSVKVTSSLQAQPLLLYFPFNSQHFGKF